jgi:hypothetical protein
MVEERASAQGSRYGSRPDGPIHHLETFAERLRADGWYARLLFADAQTPALRVVNPAAVPLNDDITLGQDEAGAWWFHWSFGERIAHVGDPDVAAARIARVLGCADS